jgi:sporulation protein YlmC with PRC-barrel domain
MGASFQCIYKSEKMIEQRSVTRTESAKHNLRIKVLLEKLRAKLKDFTVLDRQGLVVGTVKDVNINSERQLNLVVSETNTDSNSRLFLLRSSHIQNVDYFKKSLSTDLSKLESYQLPEFNLPDHPGVELSILPPPPAIESAEAVEPKVTLGDNVSDASDHPTIAKSADMQEEPEDNDSEPSQVMEEEVIRLLEERLVIDTTKRKVGEVIVRKEVETRIVEVPVQYEKLIVEQISPERKQLAEIELGHEEIPGIELREKTAQKTEVATKNTELIVSGEFPSPKAASLLLDAIAMQRRHGCKKVRVEIVLEDAEHLETYQKWFDRCSG